MALLNISFYLLTPHNEKSQVYLSLFREGKRIQFPAGFQFYTQYCNNRKKKGAKSLVRKGTNFYLEYSSQIEATKTILHKLELKHPTASLQEIRQVYEIEIGKRKHEAALDFFGAWKRFTQACSSDWSTGYTVIMESIRKHLKEYETKAKQPLNLEAFTDLVWNGFKVFLSTDKGLSNNTSNKYLKALRQFLRYCMDNNLMPVSNLERLKYFDTVQPFRIALKEKEVETLANFDFSQEPRLEKVRDLFLLEILTSQRYSDVSKLLDTNYHDSDSIRIYQQKTGEHVTIPLHPKLVKHIDLLTAKYPDGFPSISNQKFNDYLKEVCNICGFTQVHSWVMQRGKEKITYSDSRYNLVTSHTGRRTFCTLALKAGINAELIMKVSGHKKYDQFKEYVSVDDEDVMKEFAGKF